MPPVNQHLIAKLRLQEKSLVDADGRVVVDAACRGCGYNLRGVPSEGGCPECGHAVADALRDDRPEHSDPRWLSRVVLGGNLAVVAGAAAAVNVTLLVLGGAVSAMTSSTNVRSFLQDYALKGLLLALGLTWLLAVLAGWLITTGDPARVGQRSDAARRWVARVGLAVCVPAMFVALWLATGFHSFAGLGHRAALFFLFTTPVVLFAGGLVGLLLCLRELSLRMADWECARMYASVCFGLGVAAGVYVLSHILLAFADSDPAYLPLCCCGLDFFAASALILWAVVLADQTRRALNAAHRRVKEAREDATRDPMDINA